MRTVANLFVLLLFLTTPGCIAVAAGAAATAGYVQFDRNKAHRDFDDSFERVWNAARVAVEDLGYAPDGVEVEGPTEIEGELEGPEIWVGVELYPEGFVCVAVRIGTFRTKENRKRAVLFLEEVERILGPESIRGEISHAEIGGEDWVAAAGPDAFGD